MRAIILGKNGSLPGSITGFVLLLSLVLGAPYRASAQIVPSDLSTQFEVPTGDRSVDVDTSQLGVLPPLEPLGESSCRSLTESEVNHTRKALPGLVYGDITLSANLALDNLDPRIKHVVIGCMLLTADSQTMSMSDLNQSARLLKGGSVGMAICEAENLKAATLDIPMFVPPETIGKSWSDYICGMWLRTEDTEVYAGARTHPWTRPEPGTPLVAETVGALDQ